MLVISGMAVSVAVVLSRPGSNGDHGWRRIWLQSFAGHANQGLNGRYWKYDTGKEIFGTGEIETMTDSVQNVHLDGHGHLAITAIRRRGDWTSGRIQTRNDEFAAPRGGELMVVASIKQPGPANGAGYWPAFWLLGPGSWPAHGEIDVMEDVNALSEYSGAFHCGGPNYPGPNGGLNPCHQFGLSSGLRGCATCQSTYHRYSVIIDRRHAGNEQIRWYIDGREFFSVSERQVGPTAWVEAVDHGFSIIFDLAVGGAYPDAQCSCMTPNSQTDASATMSIDYVAVYSR